MVGDWSGDGHGHYREFIVTSNKLVSAARAAYFVAKAKHPRLGPDRYCARFARGRPTDDQLAELEVAGAPADAIAEFRSDTPDDLVLAFMKIVVWFIGLGDPELRLALIPELPSFNWHTVGQGTRS